MVGNERLYASTLNQILPKMPSKIDRISILYHGFPRSSTNLDTCMEMVAMAFSKSLLQSAKEGIEPTFQFAQQPL